MLVVVVSSPVTLRAPFCVESCVLHVIHYYCHNLFPCISPMSRTRGHFTPARQSNTVPAISCKTWSSGCLFLGPAVTDVGSSLQYRPCYSVQEMKFFYRLLLDARTSEFFKFVCAFAEGRFCFSCNIRRGDADVQAGNTDRGRQRGVFETRTMRKQPLLVRDIFHN